jgi:methylmalonyl-CoA mutase C-terminal domain/subunit
MSGKKRIVMAKLGLDSHDNGLRIVAKWLMDIGYEVIYAGVYNSAESIVRMTIEEDADAVGISFLGGEHLHYTDKLIRLLKEQNAVGVKIFIGGVIPPPDVIALMNLGVHAVFTPGTRRETIVQTINQIFQGRKRPFNKG